MHEQANLHANTYVFYMHYTFFDFFLYHSFRNVFFVPLTFVFLEVVSQSFTKPKNLLVNDKI